MFGFSNPQYYQQYKRGKVVRDRITRTLLLLLLIILIPLGIKVLQKQTDSAQTTKPYTRLLVSSPVKSIAVGNNISVTVILVPYETSVSVVKLVLSYDKTALSIAEPFTINTLAFPTTLVNPDYTTCNGDTCYISFTVSTGANDENAITKTTTIGSLVFTALQPVARTAITVDQTSQVLSYQNQKPTQMQISPFIFSVNLNKQTDQESGSPFAQTSNCSYQTICLTCPAGQLCSSFSCTKQLVCLSPTRAENTPSPTPTTVPMPSQSPQTPTPTIYTSPTPPPGCDDELVCPTCAPGTACQQSCEMKMVCATNQ